MPHFVLKRQNMIQKIKSKFKDNWKLKIERKTATKLGFKSERKTLNKLVTYPFDWYPAQFSNEK